MSKTNYLTILFIIWVNFWDLKPFGGNISSDMTQILLLVYLIAGAIAYRKNRIKFKISQYKPLIIIFCGIFLSMIPAYIYYGQGFVQSLISYRNVYFLASLIFFFKISPTPNEFFNSIKKFSVILAVMYIIKLNIPQLFFFSERNLEMQEYEDYAMVMGGYGLLTIAIFMRLQNMRQKLVAKDLYWVIFYLAIILLMQNRSMLFTSLVIIAYQLMHIKSKYKPFIIIFCIGLFIYFGIDIINNLVVETKEQLADEDYNRNKALAYFLSATTENSINAILGCGFISARTSPIMQNLMDNGIFNSDVGLVGFWNQYGILPVVAIMYLFISTFRQKGMPPYMKMLATMHLMCFLTLEYYGSYGLMLRFMIFYYLYYYYKNLNWYNRNAIIKNNLQ